MNDTKEDCKCDKCPYEENTTPGSECKYCTAGGIFRAVMLPDGYTR
jgi:hypothetical protein